MWMRIFQWLWIGFIYFEKSVGSRAFQTCYTSVIHVLLFSLSASRPCPFLSLWEDEVVSLAECSVDRTATGVGPGLSRYFRSDKSNDLWQTKSPEKLEDVDLCNPLHYPVAVSYLPISLAPYGASQSTSSPLVLKIVTDNKRQQQSAIERQCNEWIYIPATDFKCTQRNVQ